jgi:hypothetical protein
MSERVVGVFLGRFFFLTLSFFFLLFLAFCGALIFYTLVCLIISDSLWTIFVHVIVFALLCLLVCFPTNIPIPLTVLKHLSSFAARGAANWIGKHKVLQGGNQQCNEEKECKASQDEQFSRLGGEKENRRDAVA